MGVYISSALTLSAAAALTADFAKIGYQKITGTITASTETAGFPASAANNELTGTYWKPTAMPATWEIDAGAAESVDYIGIAAHTFGTDNTSVAIEYYDGAAWQVIDDINPGDNAPIMFIFTQRNEARYRLNLTGPTVPRVGVVFVGKHLEMQRGMYVGHSPITLSRKTFVRNNISEAGQFLGRSIVRTGSGTSYQWDNLTSTWYRENFDPFVVHAQTKPFFIAWKPVTYSNEVGYVWLPEGRDIMPSNSGTLDYMSVSMDVEGLAHD